MARQQSKQNTRTEKEIKNGKKQENRKIGKPENQKTGKEENLMKIGKT